MMMMMMMMMMKMCVCFVGGFLCVDTHAAAATRRAPQQHTAAIRSSTQQHTARSPTRIVSRPTSVVATVRVSSAVPTVVASSKPLSLPMSATAVAIADRKMRPTSCGWPTAKGRAEKSVKAAWCMAAERKEKRARAPNRRAYSGSFVFIYRGEGDCCVCFVV